MAMRGSPDGTRETLRRSLRSFGAFVDLGRNIRASHPEEHLYRQALIAGMGISGATSGAVFRHNGQSAELLEAFGPWGPQTSRTSVSLTRAQKAATENGESVRLLNEDETSGWSELLLSSLPALEPRLLVLLERDEHGPVGFLLLGDRAGTEPYGNFDRDTLRTLSGMFSVVADRLASQRPRKTTVPAASNGGETATASHPALGRFLGQSEAVRQILSDLQGVAGTDCPLLIEGESGTGKELLASIAHEIACGSGAPFEAVSCGAIPETLIESELFGHVKGAFTGALRDHRGVFDRGRGGTVFLDEIGEMPLNMQVKLLRVLQEGNFLPVGGEELHPVRSNLIAATNRDLLRESEAGRFRQDLFYRLNVFPIRLPPLRERAEDIPLLVEHFLVRHAGTAGRRPPVIRAAARRRLRVYSYPGNVRELQNIVRSLLVEVRGGNEIHDKHVVAVFSRHRVGGVTPAPQKPATAVASPPPTNVENVGDWVIQELRRYYFNLALAERMLEKRRRVASVRKAVPVYSRSGLTYYLQGEFFRALPDCGWDTGRAAERLAGDVDQIKRVRGKLDGFLSSAVDAMSVGPRSQSGRLRALQTRFAKIPTCYGPDLERLAAEFERGRWR